MAVDSVQFVEDVPEEQPAEDAAATAPTEDKQPDKQPAEKKPTHKVLRTEVSVQSNTAGRSKSDLQLFCEEERSLHLRDMEVQATADAKNAVESYVYDMRSKLEEHLAPFISDADKASFRQLMDHTENWLYDEGEDTTKDVYVSKLSELKVCNIKLSWNMCIYVCAVSETQ